MPIRNFSADDKMKKSYQSKYPLLFDKKGLMKIYECSGKSKKLKMYQHIPGLLFLPLFYFTFGNYWALFKVGVSITGIIKSLGFTFMTLFTISIRGNLAYNSKTLLEIMYLHRDGMHVKTVMING
jgi:hypothetical protein